MHVFTIFPFCDFSLQQLMVRLRHGFSTGVRRVIGNRLLPRPFAFRLKSSKLIIFHVYISDVSMEVYIGNAFF